MTPKPQEWIATLFLFLTLVHTLSANAFLRWSHRIHGSIKLKAALHLLGEVEFIFGFWGILYLIACSALVSLFGTLQLVTHLHFSEAIFVTSVMVAASTRPVLVFAEKRVLSASRMIPAPKAWIHTRLPELFSILFITPLLGSLITEPAAMTVAALLLQNRILGKNPSSRLLYSTLATLFVNISIGGVLTSFAAPPVLMVARTWNWDSLFMFSHFGWKAILAVFLNSGILCFLNRAELAEPPPKKTPDPVEVMKSPTCLLILNLGFLLFSVLNVHHALVLIPGLVLFLFYLSRSRPYQGAPKLESSFLVGFFLAGLTILAAEQGWWIKPLLARLGELSLFLGAGALTAITDNAALTSLASQAEDLSPLARYFVVAGAVSGGGLTLIANAPNPAGFSLLKQNFGPEGLRAFQLLKFALLPTLIAGAFLWIH